MTGGLRQRDTEAAELMDDPDCDPVRLARTYRQFAAVNRVLSGWRHLYRRRLRPLLDRHRDTSLLDIGFGGGDVARSLRSWSARDGLRLTVTAIDPDERALDHVRGRPSGGVDFRQAHTCDLVDRGERFDLVVSNHLLHHLDPTGLDSLLHDSLALQPRLVVHNDLARARPGLVAFGLVTRPLARGSFLHQDGMRSIRRSYRAEELRQIVPEGWHVEPMVPQRLLLTHGPASR